MNTFLSILFRFGIIAANSCAHRVSTRCVEHGDHAAKDNILVYDFWQPGFDYRRPQEHAGLRHRRPNY